MKHIKKYFRHYFRLSLYCFDSKETIAETYRFISEIYSESAPSVKTYE